MIPGVVAINGWSRAAVRLKVEVGTEKKGESRVASGSYSGVHVDELPSGKHTYSRYVSPLAIALLLFVIFDNFRRAHFCVVRILPELAQGAALAQKIPALVQFDLQFSETFLVVNAEFSFTVQLFFLANQSVDVVQNRIIFLFGGHVSPLPPGGLTRD